ncbi:hypothetical protein HFO55_34995 [Rhizobium leguminosarum]|nr:hypothetical protein [Rhizobium leguminosarum]MBY5572301.1 hypothetical protein [Rhizobium leguminosarum]MBY5578974.1 hypothetical protein [Rhizobium leguminosarum]
MAPRHGLPPAAWPENAKYLRDDIATSGRRKGIKSAPDHEDELAHCKVKD